MLKNEERMLALKNGGAVVGFSQIEELCRGYVAWWLRRRLKLATSKKASNFFVGKRFDHDQKKIDGNPFDRFTLDDEGKNSKPYLLANEFKDDAGLIPMHRYIRTGDATGKTMKQRVEIASPPSSDQRQVDDFRQFLNMIQVKKCVVYIKMACDGPLDHALGLDCTGPGITYFDPNIGEFSFHSVNDLFNWWNDCYTDRSKPAKAGITGSAFSRFKGYFVYYKYDL